jgi:aminoglycoside phosphotransferase family enzyme/predicted kinase
LGPADSGVAMNKNLPPLIAAMLRPEFYPDPPAEVELRQTHISYVFIAGARVYKVKKPVKFPFLDYSTLDRRRHFCAEEVRLNRRLAPNTYLGTVGIGRAGRAFSLDRDSGRPVKEYAVEMKRLPDSGMLSSLLRRDSVGSDCLVAIAKKLAAFHARAPTDKATVYGSPQAIAANLRENFHATRQFVDRTITGPSFTTIKTYSEAFQKEHAALMAGRVAQGRVCEGHGDLRAEHICLVDEIEIFDCVEFNVALRYGDIASEIAFLSMDLDFFGCAHLSRQFETAYAAAAGDPAMATLLPFYKCYRAYVRGKVESLKSEEQEISAADRQRASLQALHYFCLATRYTESRRKPILLIVCGLIATGKSTVAGLLSNLTGFPVFSSDQVRKKLAGIAPTSRRTDKFQKGIYAEQFTEQTYASLLETVEKCLASSSGVIIDATFAAPRYRSQFINLAGRFNVPVLFVECRSAEKTIRERLAARAKDPNEVSDATWAVYRKMREEFKSFSGLSKNCHVQLNTDRNLTRALGKLQAKL